MTLENREFPRDVAIIGTYPPRQCGIATFTSDVVSALAKAKPDLNILAVPINDREQGYPYGSPVRFEIAERDIDAYRRAADFLNINGVDITVLQHEFGIFGGKAGSHILTFLRELHMPLVSVLHTVLREPDRAQKRVLSEICRLSDRVVVMSHLASDFLTETYEVPKERIAVIPHGIPDVPFVDPNFYKDQFGAAGKVVLLTFGLLSPSKGIENVIEALPKIREKVPDIVYIVLGATHPTVAAHHGEAYRLSLQQLARQRGVEDNVVFYDQFVRVEELVEFIGAADIYITPYVSAEQTVSGTLAYTVGTGKAVISTPYWYAEELLGEGRGKLVPFHDPDAIAKQVVKLLNNPTERHAMRKRAYMLGREMIWSKVAEAYLALFQQVREQRFTIARPSALPDWSERVMRDLPPVNLSHLRIMTDSTGMIEHATFSIPNYAEGYSTDDNARALIVAALASEAGVRSAGELPALMSRYLAFISHAFDAETGHFHNDLSYERRWRDDVPTDDAHGRALWSAGTIVGRIDDPGLVGAASKLFEGGLGAVAEFETPRPWAFTLIGIHEYLKRFEGDRRAQQTRADLMKRFVELYHANRSKGWEWFESSLTYDNATLCRALLLAGSDTDDQESITIALRSLRWLVDLQSTPFGHFVPIGSQGFYSRGGERARFDQQPIEAYATVSACLDALRVTGDPHWRNHAQIAFDWFLGRNDVGTPLIDTATGACCDGVMPEGLNHNQGAESTLAYLLSLLELRLAEEALEGRVEK